MSKSNFGVLLTVATMSFIIQSKAFAVEGGNGAYLLVSRDSLSGIVPPPGTYITNDMVYIKGEVSFLEMGGAVLTDVSTSVFLNKINITHSFEQKLFGGQFAITGTLPIVTGSLDFSGELSSGLGGSLSDHETGLGDLTFTPSLGWSDGNFHGSVAASIFLPTGKYDTASVDIPNRKVRALNFGKNRAAIDPTLNFTYLNPENGREFTASAGVTFSLENPSTNYQTAPEFHLEMTAMQHLPSKLAIGLTGYAYQQIGDDSGAGSASTRSLTGADSLRASVYGVGPILTYGAKINDISVSIKAKYLHEFAAKRRLESDVVWLTLGVGF